MKNSLDSLITTQKTSMHSELLFKFLNLLGFMIINIFFQLID